MAFIVNRVSDLCEEDNKGIFTDGKFRILRNPRYSRNKTIHRTVMCPELSDTIHLDFHLCFQATKAGLAGKGAYFLALYLLYVPNLPRQLFSLGALKVHNTFMILFLNSLMFFFRDCNVFSNFSFCRNQIHELMRCIQDQIEKSE